jgi:hypothetical protein
MLIAVSSTARHHIHPVAELCVLCLIWNYYEYACFELSRTCFWCEYFTFAYAKDLKKCYVIGYIYVQL